MKPYTIGPLYNRIHTQVFTLCGQMAKENALKGRLLGLPLGLFSLLTIPVAKVLQFGEALLGICINAATLQGADLTLCMRAAGTSGLGVLASPFTAIFSSVAVWTAMTIDPVGTSQRFLSVCESHHSGRVKPNNAAPSKQSPASARRSRR